MKKSSLLRPDKTGKAIVTILRHVGRLQEVTPQHPSAFSVVAGLCERVRPRSPRELYTRWSKDAHLHVAVLAGAPATEWEDGIRVHPCAIKLSTSCHIQMS